MRNPVDVLITSVLAACLFVVAHAVAAQAPNPNYTDDMPSVERVKAEIRGSDATDSLARQVAVFNYLLAYIDRIKYSRTARGAYTPGEQKMVDAYRLASYQISQEYAKSHTPAQANEFERLHGRYEIDDAFYADWSKRLIGKQTAAAYKGAETDLAARQKAHIDEEKRQYEEGEAKRKAAANQSQPGKPLNDPTSNAARRCLELGGTDLECLGKGLSAGLFDLMGGNDMPIGKAVTEPMSKGVRMGGTYQGENGISIVFGPDSATIGGCGQLEPTGGGYNVTPRGQRLLIEIQNEPKPLDIALGPGGQIAGPGMVEITGRVVTGYQVYNVQSRYSDGNIVPGSVHQERVPIYAPRTERCSISALRPVSTTASDAGGIALISSLISGEESKEMQEDEKHPTPAGPRMAGIYKSPGGLRLDFHPVAVILDCGEAHVARPYSVKSAGDAMVVTVGNDATPFAMTLRQDGTLAGSGSTEVSGRLLTGRDQNGLVFQPRRETCAIGALSSQ